MLVRADGIQLTGKLKAAFDDSSERFFSKLLKEIHVRYCTLVPLTFCARVQIALL
jgi:hypothetical protein